MLPYKTSFKSGQEVVKTVKNTTGCGYEYMAVRLYLAVWRVESLCWSDIDFEALLLKIQQYHWLKFSRSSVDIFIILAVV